MSHVMKGDSNRHVESAIRNAMLVQDVPALHDMRQRVWMRGVRIEYVMALPLHKAAP